MTVLVPRTAFAADAGQPVPAAPGGGGLSVATGTLLPDGKALVVVQGTGAVPPERGVLDTAAGRLAWQAVATVLRDPAGADQPPAEFSVLALLSGLPTGAGTLTDRAGQVWQVGAPQRIGASVAFLVASAQAAGLDLARVFGVLAAGLQDAVQANAPEARALRGFASEFLETVAARDGFIEVLAEPVTGGLFLQGWAQSLGEGPLAWISLDAPLDRPVVTAAFFARPDLLDPAQGLCLYGVTVALACVRGAGTVFLEQDGRLLRLDLVGTAAQALTDAAAMGHVAGMLPRLTGRTEAVSAFRRICRPRYGGADTLSGTGLPVAMGLDTVLRAPDGTMLVGGWMLDPDRRVTMALVKSRGNRYGRISDAWVRLPRPDLYPAFRDDPRFAGRLTPVETLHGFIARVPPPPEPQPDGGGDPDVYVELVLDDDSCLFLPLTPVEVLGPERLTPVLAALSPSEPQLARIIDAHLVPFLAGLHPARGLAQAQARGAARVPPIPLGQAGASGAARRLPALMPVASLDDLQPVLALLAGTPDAAALDLHLIVTRALAETALADLQSAFRFYGLCGHLVLAPDSASRARWLDAALAVIPDAQEGPADPLLVWTPRVLPKGRGWLARLQAEAAAAGQGGTRVGALSPALTHEDGSIAYGPPSAAGSVVGFAPGALHRGPPVRVAGPAPDILLADRGAILAAGGFAGQMLTDAHAHVDLGARLDAAGWPVWCSGSVEFWRLDTALPAPPPPEQRILRRIDARLLAHRGLPDPEEEPA
ncbi:MAG: hypothetical protein MUF73_01145 [Rhodobacteraceae bacterium]|jgi:hypothetical protein|nr:hypothetical protein [Paracoccaceae bacterium]